jgi:t-SNARE complex subunit (syntaxin)
MIEVNAIFEDFARLLVNQSPMIDSIAFNLKQTQNNLTNAVNQLNVADKSK